MFGFCISEVCSILGKTDLLCICYTRPCLPCMNNNPCAHIPLLFSLTNMKVAQIRKCKKMPGEASLALILSSLTEIHLIEISIFNNVVLRKTILNFFNDFHFNKHI